MAIISILAGCSNTENKQNSSSAQTYQKYEVIINCLEAKDYDGAISEITKMKNEEQSITQGEEQPTNSPTPINEQFMSATSIGLYENIDIYTTAITGSYYTLNCYGDNKTCNFSCREGDDESESLYCQFSKDVFDHVLNTICSTELKELPLPTDENGKLVETWVHDCIVLGCGSETYYFDEIDNKDEIIKCFTDLRDSAKE